MSRECNGVMRAHLFALMAGAILLIAACGGAEDLTATSASKAISSGPLPVVGGSMPSRMAVFSEKRTALGISAGLGAAIAKPMLAGGFFHTLALKSDGTAWAWGDNSVGQLGNRSTTDSGVPSGVSTLLPPVVGVSSGELHNLAVTADGAVWAWGYNSHGEIGAPSSVYVDLRINEVPGLAGVVGVSAGYGYSLALKSDGTVWAWGSNNYGVYGNASMTNSYIPVQVPGLNGVKGISAGFAHVLAVKSDGTVWAWGANYAGQLGIGSKAGPQLVPPVQVSGLTDILTVAAGGGHSLALRSDGTVWSWGRNSNGELGNNSTTESLVPVQVSELTSALTVAAGDSHSLALRSDGTVWSWGRNTQGQLGTNSTISSPVPVQVAGMTNVVTLNSGRLHSMALKADGSVWTWGTNEDGQLGNNSFVGSLAPVQVLGPDGIGFLDLGPALPPPASLSKIIFLHGIGGSSLFTCEGTTAKGMWLTTKDTDFSLLALGSDGKPRGVTFVDGPLQQVIFGKEIYQGFTDFMNRNFPGALRPFPYDWRLDPDTVIDQPTTLGTPTDADCAALNSGAKTIGDFPKATLVEVVRQLAAESPTGKISIIAHSNGGLIAKRLVQRLGAAEAAAIIEKIILVATPQFGTPQAVGTLLHGLEFPLPSILLPAKLARDTSLTLKGTNQLLPSSGFFTATAAASYPIILFGDVGTDPQYSLLKNYYGDAADTRNEYLSFLLGDEGRETPGDSTQIPDLVRLPRWSEAADLHATIDPLVDQAASPLFIEIAGTGRPTTRAVEYKLVGRCTGGSGLSCSYVKEIQPLKTTEGDGTVLLRSAIAMTNAPSYVVDLADVCRSRFSDREHSTVLSYEPVQELLRLLLKATLNKAPQLAIQLCCSAGTLNRG